MVNKIVAVCLFLICAYGLSAQEPCDSLEINRWHATADSLLNVNALKDSRHAEEIHATIITTIAVSAVIVVIVDAYLSTRKH
jgi:hypothetical protein